MAESFDLGTMGPLGASDPGAGDPQMQLLLYKQMLAKALRQTGGGGSQQPMVSPWQVYGSVAKDLANAWSERSTMDEIRQASKDQAARSDSQAADALSTIERWNREGKPTPAPAAVPEPAAPVGGAGFEGRADATQRGDPRDLAIRTQLAEAGGEGDLGQSAVAHVINNRVKSGKWGPDAGAVVQAPMQFSPWNAGSTNDPRRFRPDSPEYQNAASIYDRAVSGAEPDPTGGALHFANPQASTAAWVKKAQEAGDGTRIGNHVFYRGLNEGIPQQGPAPGTGGGPQMAAALADPSVSSVTTQPQTMASGGVPPVTTAIGAPPATTAGNAIDPKMRASMAAALMPAGSKAQKIYAAYAASMGGGEISDKAVQQRIYMESMKPDRELTPIVQRDGSTKMMRRSEAANVVSSPPVSPRHQLETPEVQQQKLDQARAGATQVSQNTGDRVAHSLVSKHWIDVVEPAAQTAQTRVRLYDTAERAMTNFSPGVLADKRLWGLQMAQELGINTKGVVAGDELKTVQRRLELANTPKGQGSITENERGLIRENLPVLLSSPGGALAAIRIGRELDQIDIDAAKIYRENARKNGGAPDPAGVSEAMADYFAKKPRPDIQYVLDNLKQSGAPGAAPGGAAATPGPLILRDGKWIPAP